MLEFRSAAAPDAPALMALRNHYIRHSYASFDEEPLELDAVERWMENYGLSGPHRLWLAVEGGQLLGYACSQRYRDHPAFARTIETSIYVSPSHPGRGVGSALYARLFESLQAEGLHRAVVGIALPNEASVALHRRFGFEEVGVFREYAFKQGRALSSVWMQRAMDLALSDSPLHADAAAPAPPRC